LLALLDWPIEALRRHAERQVISRASSSPSENALVIYLTGDNCDQPNEEFLKELAAGSRAGH